MNGEVNGAVRLFLAADESFWKYSISQEPMKEYESATKFESRSGPATYFWLRGFCSISGARGCRFATEETSNIGRHGGM